MVPMARGGRWRAAGTRRREGGQVALHRVGVRGQGKRPFEFPILPTEIKPAKEKTMTTKGRPYEPLTSENAALILVDHQIGLMTGVRDYPIALLKHNVVALAKAAEAFQPKMPGATTARGRRAQ